MIERERKKQNKKERARAIVRSNGEKLGELLYGSYKGQGVEHFLRDAQEITHLKLKGDAKDIEQGKSLSRNKGLQRG